MSAAELVDEAIARVERLNGELDAVIVPLFDEARKEAASASGPFAGVPWVLKDLGPVSKGYPHAGGLLGARQAGWVADHDSYLVEAMRAAGFVLVGKTNTPELGLVPTTEPAASLDRLRRGAAAVEAWWLDHDVLLAPTIPTPPAVLGHVASTEVAAQVVAFTIPANITGQPAISLPTHETAGGLPIGVQLEQAMPRHDRRPRVSA